ncbi:HU family DNA-binding protein [Balneolales bacterium ANBcel1]|nr:HU family DNA-binding protein [Balneolales bacterium ANBcel1]
MEQEKAIQTIITGALKKHRDVAVKGLGTFAVRHRKQDHRQQKDGTILLDPPADIVTFTPEK